MADIEVLPEKDITVENLLNIFKKAYISASIDDDGDLMINTERCRVFLSINEKAKLLKYVTFYKFKDDFSAKAKLKFVNTLNDNIIFARFSCPEQRQEALLSEYYLSYEEGVVVFSIIESLRLFVKVTVGALEMYDEDNMIQ